MSNSTSCQMKFVSLHIIDRTQDTSTMVDLKGKECEVSAYIDDLVLTITNDVSNRMFKFRGNSTEVSSAVDQLIACNYTNASQIIADRLLKKEKEAASKYAKITDILKGSLVQTYIEHDGRSFVFIAKLDHHSFLDEIDLTKHTGLPYKKKVLKAALIPVDNGKKRAEVKIYDTNSRISDYWWHDFLELEELRSDEKNTQVAFHAVDSLLSREVGNKSKHDYMILRNATIFYFRNKLQMEYDKFVSDLLDNYTPTVSAVDVTRLKERVRELPQNKSFDSKFNLEKSAIKARISRSIWLQENLELHLKAEVKDLEHVIEAYNENGVKGIKIRTEKGWNYFKK